MTLAGGIALGASATLLAGWGLFRLARAWRRRQRAHFAARDLEFRRARAAGLKDPPNPVVSPMPLAALDPVRSPFTGLTRASWLDLAEQLLRGMLHYSDGLRRALRMPGNPVANYPRLAAGGGLIGLDDEYLEAFCRSLWLAAPVLANRPDLRLGDRLVADWYHEWLVHGVTPEHPHYLGIGAGPGPTPHIMEAAAVCVALRQAPEVLWAPLSAAERGRVLAWLDAVRHRPVVPNNWRWFSVIVETFLKTEGVRHDEARVADHLQALLAFHADSGWSRDLDKFDYYAAWSLQFYPIFWLRWDGDSRPDMRDKLLARNDEFLESFPHVLSRRGELPRWGRSPIYRFGAVAPLMAAFLRPRPPTIDPGFARRLSSGALLQFVRHPGFLDRGLPSLGWLGEEPGLVDHYSGVASPYWCAKAFVGLTLPETSPVWSAVETEGFWADPPAAFTIGSTGLHVTHDRGTGHTRLFAPQPVPRHDPRYQAPWFDTADAV